MDHKIQLSLDFLELSEALKSVEKLEHLVDWVSVSEPLINSEGLDSIIKVKEQFPDKKILANVKALHPAEIEARAEAGADVIILPPAASDEVQEVIATSKKAGLEVMLDLSNSSSSSSKKILKDAGKMGLDYLLINHEQENLVHQVSRKFNIPVVISIPADYDFSEEGVLDTAKVLMLSGSVTNHHDLSKLKVRINEIIEINKIMGEKMKTKEATHENEMGHINVLLTELNAESKEIHQEKQKLEAEWAKIAEKEQQLEKEREAREEEFRKKQEGLWSEWEREQRERWTEQLSKLTTERNRIRAEKNRIKKELLEVEAEWGEISQEKNHFNKTKESIEAEKDSLKQERDKLQAELGNLEQERQKTMEIRASLEAEWAKIAKKEQQLEKQRQAREEEFRKKQEDLWLEWQTKQKDKLREHMMSAEKIILTEREKLETELEAEKEQLEKGRITLKSQTKNLEKDKWKLTAEWKNKEKELRDKQEKIQRDWLAAQEKRWQEKLLKREEEKEKLLAEKEELQKVKDELDNALGKLGITTIPELASKVSELTNLEDRIARERSELEKERSEINKLKNRKEEDSHKLEEHRLKLERELTTIERDLLKLKGRHRPGKKAEKITAELPKTGEENEPKREKITYRRKKELVNTLIDLVHNEKELELEQASQKLGVASGVIQRWGEILQKRNVVEMTRTNVGNVVLKPGAQMDKFI